jgi:ubiquinone/menaquinone biosynthesis C-methylase UbiE
LEIVFWPRLNHCVSFDFAASYGDLNPDDSDYTFYTELASRLSAKRAVDLGCGTGTLAVRLARANLDVIGIDPDPDMLRVAKQQPDNDRVTWCLGYADSMPPAWADLVTMSGHVSQVFITDAEWHVALTAVRRGLRSGGTIAFEMRNPATRAWERWTREQTMRTVRTEDGDVEFWHETRSVDLPLVTYATSTLNSRTGATTTNLDTLAFRDQRDLRTDLEDCGFSVSDIFGDWDRSAAGAGSPELIVVARKTA